jgi:hypothetical protein
MATRDHEEMTIKCPKCGHSGIAKASTGDHPWMKSEEFQVDEFPAGFVLVTAGNNRRDTQVRCSCGEAFYLSPLG